jgi:hypothetical protein
MSYFVFLRKTLAVVIGVAILSCVPPAKSKKPTEGDGGIPAVVLEQRRIIHLQSDHLDSLSAALKAHRLRLERGENVIIKQPTPGPSR